ncbi:uncharacterized protein LOC110224809 isoform X4 [Arabidopsis lyrata subsp. lyrata]|uniref:uncharacterized protein LOC110224809 isoform X4 n=1 Tax=Arabidopsis lyrata subsp. lyrata TaxID=81972 RepID=UPI000A29A290|nr:uncharacterized protein LOC110224809 isoform X4 [Arabidopsis lyrata subsp. lyrata]|eukprot:XP_020867748.1 uncharacterized protein LOC110224809 isoform X4 [Arabidopsis lyrata subsp. lyrata]
MLAKSNTWDDRKLHQLIHPEDIHLIKKIRPNLVQSPDTPTWIYTKDGHYSVKSETLAHRHLRVSQECLFCGEARESVSHIFFQCRVAKEIWELSPVHIVADASWINQDSKIGVGWMLHDSLGRYILQGSASLEPTQSVLEAEALALREALIHLKRLNYQNVTFCGDSYSLYGYLEGNMHKKLQIRGPSEIQAYLQDISKLAHVSYQFRFINRAANVLADTLAREARINDSPYVISWVL